MRYGITWDAGATAEIEFISPEEGAGKFRLRYNPPYRTTLRSPVDSLMVGPLELENCQERLEQFAATVGLSAGRGPGGAAAAPETMPVDQLKAIGLELYEFMLPRHVQADLDEETFIELALDESLTALPWELMYDGEEFLSQRHAMGRFITLRTPLPAGVRSGRIPAALDDLEVLVIGVPQPTPAAGQPVYDALPAARNEVREVVETLVAAGVQPTLLLDADATYENVRAELRKPYHIVHYSGHAAFDDAHPDRSSLLLFDRPLRTGALMVSFSEHPPVFCFINGCESSRPEAAGAAPRWEARYNNYGLARSFLETGTYLLGSRWRLEDGPAQVFARTFYEALLGSGEPVGRAIATARRATAAAGDDTCAWASYIYYGDPRIGLRRHTEAAPAMEAAPPAELAPPPPAPGRDDLLDMLRQGAVEYEQIRDAMEAGPARTQAMSRLGARMTEVGRVDLPAADLEELYALSEGGRVMALVQMRAAPDGRRPAAHRAQHRRAAVGVRAVRGDCSGLRACRPACDRSCNAAPRRTRVRRRERRVLRHLQVLAGQ